MTTELHETPYGTFLFPYEGTLVDYPRETLMAVYGFEIVDTGGGCTAWQCDRFCLVGGEPVSVVVTDTDGLSHELVGGEPVMFGVYPRGEIFSEAWAGWIQPGPGVPPQEVDRP